MFGLGLPLDSYHRAIWIQASQESAGRLSDSGQAANLHWAAPRSQVDFKYIYIYICICICIYVCFLKKKKKKKKKTKRTKNGRRGATGKLGGGSRWFGLVFLGWPRLLASATTRGLKYPNHQSKPTKGCLTPKTQPTLAAERRCVKHRA